MPRTPADLRWQDHAICTDHPDRSIFFPERGQSTAEAKAVCRTCPVRAECLEHAVTYPEKIGVWGGTSERERRRLRRQRTIRGAA